MKKRYNSKENPEKVNKKYSKTINTHKKKQKIPYSLQ